MHGAHQGPPVRAEVESPRLHEGEIIGEVSTILGQMSVAILVAASVAVLAGLAVLIGALAAIRTRTQQSTLGTISLQAAFEGLALVGFYVILAVLFAVTFAFLGVGSGANSGLDQLFSGIGVSLTPRVMTLAEALQQAEVVGRILIGIDHHLVAHLQQRGQHLVARQARQGEQHRGLEHPDPGQPIRRRGGVGPV